MSREQFTISALLAQRHSPVRNYVIPGLTSWLVGQPTPGAGVLRLFECERDQQECIAPHSHRFDFKAWVLRGEVENRVWTSLHQSEPARNGDQYATTILRYSGKIGQHERIAGDVQRWNYRAFRFKEGDVYSMRSDEVHSIIFSRGALVLFYEGPTISNQSIMLEPVCYGETVPTFRTEPWMFQRADQRDAA